MTVQRSGAEEFAFLAALVRLLGARRVLEVGTSTGDGALTLARSLARIRSPRPVGPRGGQRSGTRGGAPLPPPVEVVTVDIADLREPACRNHPGPVPIRFLKGDSGEVLARLAARGERFDLVFIDGGHHFATVRRDWELARSLTDAVVLHDVLQFNGVSRVVSAIRKDPDWDVTVLSYPGTTLLDPASGSHFFSMRCPGLALATRKPPRRAPAAPPAPPLWERPTDASRKALKRRTARFDRWHGRADRAADMSMQDWRMLFHMFWNMAPRAVVHLGHAGTGASLLFLNYARAKKARVTLADPSGNFWERKLPLMAPSLVPQIPRARVLVGPEACAALLEDAQDEAAWAERAPGTTPGGPALYWIDEYTDEAAYEIARALARRLRPGDALCLRNCSPDDGRPDAVRAFGAICTCRAAAPFFKWLAEQPVHARLANPQAVFGDYVNAGHWLMVCPRAAANTETEAAEKPSKRNVSKKESE